MTDPIAAWHSQRIRMLALLQEQVDVLAEGEVPDYRLMLDILDNLHARGDQHSPSREVKAVRARSMGDPIRDVACRRLMQGYRVIHRAGETLRTLLEEALEDAMSRAEIEAAAATYLVFFSDHIAKEKEGTALGSSDGVIESETVFEAPRKVRDPLAGGQPYGRFG